MTLETRLNALDFKTQLQEVKAILDTAEAGITFWGTRTLSVNGKRCDSVKLEKIASRALKAAYDRRDADDLTPAERVAGLDIFAKFQQLYTASDALAKTKNCFTWIIFKLREYNLYPYNTRFFIEQDYIFFCAFSAERFRQQFGMAAGERVQEHPAYRGEIGPPARFIAHPDFVRNLVRV